VHGGIKKPVNKHRATRFVDFVFDGFAAQWDFNDDVDFFWRVFANGYVFDIHDSAYHLENWVYKGALPASWQQRGGIIPCVAVATNADMFWAYTAREAAGLRPTVGG
jgi:hypothetical protein